MNISGEVKGFVKDVLWVLATIAIVVGVFMVIPHLVHRCCYPTLR